jgi:hypothetical protein
MRMRWKRHAPRMDETRNVYKIVNENLKETDHLKDLNDFHLVFMWSEIFKRYATLLEPFLVHYKATY